MQRIQPRGEYVVDGISTPQRIGTGPGVLGVF